MSEIKEIQDAIETLKILNFCGNCTTGEGKYGGCAFCERKLTKDLAIQSLTEKLEREQAWVPVSERLPENQPSWISGSTYIVSLSKQNSTVKLAKYKEGKWIGSFGRIISDNDVIAWQELPSPYKEVTK